MDAPDYSTYSLTELEDVLAHIDKELYSCVALPSKFSSGLSISKSKRQLNY
ncbi:hypothetical protein [uncultured Alteromonas sp.]|uniref:hypothetical protein n=1 Tax=uncultured Alteromonas sp. TaxID=179113 RepID=UPI00258EE8A1|nr:hypothetical protein [uncultured Alteromonas sp.]